MDISFAEPEKAVAVAGGGPTGLMLAAELALAGVDVAILERRAAQELEGSRSGGLHARTIEILDQRGVAERFLAEGKKHEVAHYASAILDVGDLPSRHPYTLGLWQKRIERIMVEWVGELGVPIHYGQAVNGFAQGEEGVDVQLADGDSLRAGYLVGCDGGRSLIRKAAGIEFPGWDASKSTLIAEVEMTEEPEFGIRHGELGISGIGPTEEDGPLRIVVTERQLESGQEPGLDELREAMVAVYGTDYGVHSPTWISRFTDATRQAASYREGRVLLAGDSAHVHYPAGGQGLQLGIQDAVNLGWKLAQVVRGTSPGTLLDTYQAERHPVTARALRGVMAAAALQRGDAGTTALRDELTELVVMEGPRKHLGAQRLGLDVRYELGDGHPLIGRRMPDLDLTADGPLRVYELLHRARPVLLNLGTAGAVEAGGWADRVQLVEAEYGGPWELPALGAVPAPDAVLIRPDGHVAWVGMGGDEGLADALGTWFGPLCSALMTLLRMDNVLIVVEDLEAAKAFFAELGMELVGEATVEGDWAGRVVGLEGVRSDIAMMRTPDGSGRVELSKFHTPPAIRAEPEDAPANALGIRRIMFTVDDVDDMVARLAKHGGELVGEIAQYEDIYRLCFLRGPEGIVVGLAEELG